MKNIFLLIFFIYLSSCGGVEFVYKESKNLVNPLYGKTQVNVSGKDLNFLRSYLTMFFGDKKQDHYNLSIKIEEKKTKRSVEINQAASNLRYELRFIYLLESNQNDCVTYKKELLSYFSILPKSSGYNYGTDSSLEKKYELAVSENLNRFVSLLSDIDINSCQ